LDVTAAFIMIVGGAVLAAVAVGGFVVLAARQAKPVAPPAHDPEHDTVAFVPVGPADGEVVRVEGRVVVLERMLRAPSGRPCVMYELYGGGEDEPARPLRHRSTTFYVDDGVSPVRIDAGTGVFAFDLPTCELDGGVERRLEPGSRVQVVGRVRRSGAPGHEEIVLEASPEAVAVTLTYLAARVSLRAA
jgi:hypothetical protein